VGINRLLIESINVLDDLGADAWRERRFRAHLDKARPSKHLRRRGIVIRHATVERCRRQRFSGGADDLDHYPLAVGGLSGRADGAVAIASVSPSGGRATCVQDVVAIGGSIAETASL
jgi:hypothetical protein